MRDTSALNRAILHRKVGRDCVTLSTPHLTLVPLSASGRCTQLQANIMPQVEQRWTAATGTEELGKDYQAHVVNTVCCNRVRNKIVWYVQATAAFSSAPDHAICRFEQRYRIEYGCAGPLKPRKGKTMHTMVFIHNAPVRVHIAVQHSGWR